MAVNNNITRTEVTRTASGWVGWVYFAAFMLIFAGIFQLISGMTALLNQTFYAISSSTIVVFDITTWGWIHLTLGLLLVCTGIALFSGSGWARAIAVIIASLNLIAQFAFIGTYPIWSIIIMLIDLLIIYALTVHGGELREYE